MENWKPVVGYKGFYEISESGIVRRLKRVTYHSKNGIMAYQIFHDGYANIQLCKHGKPKFIKRAKLVAMAFIGKRPPKYQINHIDGKKLNDHFKNLEYITQSQNMLHAYKLGLQISLVGEQCKHAKLDNKKVLEIRKLYATGNYTQDQLGKKYGVAGSMIHCIVVRKN